VSAIDAFDLLTRLWRRSTAGAGAPIDKLTGTGFVATAVVTAASAAAAGEEPVALAAVLFNAGRQGPGLATLVRPPHALPNARAMDGMDDAARSDVPPIRRALARFDAVCARRIVVAHDLDHQVAVLARARGSRVSMAPQLGLDTRRLARVAGLDDGPVDAIATSLAVPLPSAGPGVEREARAVGEILLALVPRLRTRGARTLRDLLDLQARITITA
jgi:DNA polymerase III alpha subunit (gram-positive type)